MLKKFKSFKGKLTLFRKVQYPEQTKTIQDETYVIREIVGEDIKELLQVERLVYARRAALDQERVSFRDLFAI